MTDQDYESFRREYLRLSAALERFKQSSEEQSRRLDAYFHALKAFPLGDVIAKADTWLAKETKFPKPAEWAGVIVRKVAPLPAMSDADARDYIRAEGLRYEDTPCWCPECVTAEVSEKPLRFVPLEPEQRKRLGDRIVVAGRWAHGFELFRWYRSRADYYNAMAEKGFLKGM